MYTLFKKTILIFIISQLYTLSVFADLNRILSDGVVKIAVPEYSVYRSTELNKVIPKEWQKKIFSVVSRILI